jgi:hypothetical protein
MCIMSVERKLWFRRKRFGWGWTPVTIEGWAVVGAYLVAIMALATWAGKGTPAFYAGVGVLTALVIALGYLKGEAPGWRWGGD